MPLMFDDLGSRKAVIGEIGSSENKSRKAESLKRFEVFRGRIGRYIVEKLETEFSRKTVREMRKMTSINLCPRIVNAESSIYNKEPIREFGELSDNEREQIENLYFKSKFDSKMKLANRYYNLFDQVTLQIIPKAGKLQIRPLPPHQVDVIPFPDNPEKPFAYIMSVFDKFEFLARQSTDEDLSNPRAVSSRNFIEEIDRFNQTIADPDDYQSTTMKYIVWTDDMHFVMNGKGELMTEIMPNPIGMLPFVDIADEKDFEFWVRKNNDTAQFAIDYGVLLSDILTVNKMQGHSQAIIFADKQPENMEVGPNKIMFLQMDPERPESQPRFEFASPSPDMNASISLLENTLRLYLTAKGLDPKLISGTADATRFNSGLERMLAMIDQFEASMSDFALFREAESQSFEIMKRWSNVMQGTIGLDPDLQGGIISDNATFEIKFEEPQGVQTKAELESSVLTLMDRELMSRSEAIMELRGVDEDMAKDILTKIDQENGMGGLIGGQNQTTAPSGGTEDQS